MKYEITVEENEHGTVETARLDVAVGTSIADAFRASPHYQEELEYNLLDVTPVGEEDEPIPADDRFPDRPTHPDFARLSSAAAEQDAVADMLGVKEATSVDFQSLSYVAQNRISVVYPTFPLIPPEQGVGLIALYVDAFQLGVGFTERGGHRPTETGTTGEKEGSL